MPSLDPSLRILLVLACVATDLVLSIGCLCQHQSGTHHRQAVRCHSGHYRFADGTADFVILMVFRSLALIVGLIMSLRIRLRDVSHTVYGAIIATNAAYSAFKALAFSTMPKDLVCSDIFPSGLWNFIAFPAMLVVWRYFLCVSEGKNFRYDQKRT